MSQTSIDEILSRLRADPNVGWPLFVDEYAPLILQVIRHIESNPDDASDCFQFVCERLCEGGCRRLQKFRPGGAAAFPTWLRAVVRNLCLDWRRKQFGRRRTFRSISRLSQLDQEIFHRVYEQGASEGEALCVLLPRFRDLTPENFSESIERINEALTTKQRWRLAGGVARDAVLRPSEGGLTRTIEASDPRPNPETRAILAERSARLRRAVNQLSDRERLLLRLRFEEDLTFEQIAGLLDLGNAQRADRQIKEVLTRLSHQFAGDSTMAGGKSSASSVKALRKKSN